MSAPQFAVLVIATVFAVAGGVAALAAELSGSRRPGRRGRHAAEVVIPYAGLALLLWTMWREA